MVVLPNCCLLPLELLLFDIKHFLSGGKLAQTSFEYLWKTFILNSTGLDQIKIVSPPWWHAMLKISINKFILGTFQLWRELTISTWNVFFLSVSFVTIYLSYNLFAKHCCAQFHNFAEKKEEDECWYCTFEHLPLYFDILC